MLAFSVDQLFVNFVGDDIEVMRYRKLAEPAQALFAVDRPSGIVRGIDHDRAGFRGDGLLNGAQVEGKGLRNGIDQNRNALRQFDNFHIADPAGLGNDHLVPRIDHRQNRVEQRLFGSGGNGNLIGVVGDAVVLKKLVADCLTQLRNSADLAVLCFSLFHRAGTRHDNVGGGIEIRFTGIQTDHIDSLGMQIGNRAFQLNGGGWGHSQNTLAFHG